MTEELGFGLAVEDEASAPLGEIEDAYLSLMQTMEVFHKKLAKSMKTHSDRTDEVADAAQDAGEAVEKSKGRFAEMGEAIRDNWLGLDRLGISWGQVISVLAGLSVGAAIAGVVGWLKRAIDKANEFQQTFARLNEQFAMSRKEGREVASALASLELRAARSRDEVAGLIGTMLDIGLVPEKVKALGLSFRSLARDALDLSSATGVSTQASAEFMDQVIRINRVPTHNIRGIAFAIKSIADNSRISADELLSFNKNLEPIFANLADRSAGARQAFTLDMFGIAGALSDLNIDANKATSKFADMMDRTSASGNKALGQLSLFTNVGTEQLRKMMEENPAAIFDEVAKAASNMPTDQLRILARSLEPLGLDFVDLTKMRKIGEELQSGGEGFATRADAARKAAEDQEALAEAAAKRQAAIEARQNRINKMIQDFQIRVGSWLIEILIPHMDTLTKKAEQFVNFLENIKWDKLAKDVKPYWDLFSDGFSLVVKGGGATYRFLSDGLDGFLKFSQKNWDVWKSISVGNWAHARKEFVAQLRTVADLHKTVFTRLMPDSVEAWAKEKIPAALSSVKTFFRETWEDVKTGAQNAWDSAVLGAQRMWERLKEVLKTAKDYWANIFTGVGELVFKAFNDVREKMIDVLDQVLVYLGRDLAPKLAPFAKFLPGDTGTRLLDALKEAGASAEVRVEQREIARKRQERLNEAIRHGTTIAPVVSVNAASSSIPDKITTSSPTVEALLREQTKASREIVEALRQRNRESSVAALKRNFALSNSGH